MKYMYLELVFTVPPGTRDSRGRFKEKFSSPVKV